MGYNGGYASRLALPYHTTQPNPSHCFRQARSDFLEKIPEQHSGLKSQKKFSKNGHSLGISKTMFAVISLLCLRFGILKVSLLALSCTPGHHHQHLLLFHTDLFSRFHRHFLITSRLLLLYVYFIRRKDRTTYCLHYYMQILSRDV